MRAHAFLGGLVVSVFASFSLAQPSPAPKPARAARALVIGIDKYEAPPAVDGGSPSAPKPGRRWTSLDGAVNDAQSVKAMLTSRFDVSPANITLLTDAAATRAAILAALRKLAADSRPGDVAFVYYAGHGSQQVNSLTDELDKKDETLVPVDWADIRDKELAVELGAILDKDATLTVVLDSCHSGSGTRGVGKARYAEGNDEDVKDATRVVDNKGKCMGGGRCVVAPEARGAVIISASLDSQQSQEAVDEKNVPHGAFTLAFIKAVADGPNASVERIFAKARANMATTGRAQEPELVGSPERRAKALLGGEANGSGRYPVVIKSVSGQSVRLQGGSAMGLTAGCELELSAKKASLRITKVDGMVESTAEVVSSEKPLAQGDEVVVTKWKAGSFTPLYLYLPRGVPQAKLTELRGQLTGLEKDALISVVKDPTAAVVDAIAVWDGAKWALYSLQQTADLGTRLSAKAIVAALGRAKPAVFVVLPTLDALAIEGLDEPDNSVQRASDLRTADYLVAGAVQDGKLKYALLNVTAMGTPQPVAFPRRTDWFEVTPTLAGTLRDRSWMLARLKGWLTLSQQGPSSFPFDLSVEPEGAPAGGGTESVLLGIGQTSRVILRNPASDPAADLRSWWVYLVAIDSDGKGTMLTGDKEVFAKSKEVTLLADMNATEPPGLDHLLLVATEKKLPSTAMLGMDAVATRTARGGPDDPFSKLFASVGVRGQSVSPGGWGVRRTTLRTVRPWDPPEGRGAAVAPRSRGALPNEGPELELMKPVEKQDVMVPAEIDIRFKPRTAPVDLSSLKIELVTIIKDFDITAAVLESSTVTPEGLRSVTSRTGEFRLRVSLADLAGKRTAVEYLVRTK